LGFGGLGPTPQPPNPNPQSPIPNPLIKAYELKKKLKNKKNIKLVFI